MFLTKSPKIPNYVLDHQIDHIYYSWMAKKKLYCGMTGDTSGIVPKILKMGTYTFKRF